MTTTRNATAKPWTATTLGLHDEYKHTIADANGVPILRFVVTYEYPAPSDRDDVIETVLRAVNAYDTLRTENEAMRTALRECVTVLVFLVEENPLSSYKDVPQPFYVLGSKEALTQARALLARLEKGERP